VGTRFLEECTAARPSDAPTRVSDYVSEHKTSGQGKIIGTGGFSWITLETDSDGRQFAVKHTSNGGLDETIFLREVEALIKLNHPCVLRIFGFAFPRENKPSEIHMEYTACVSLDSVMRRGKLGDPALTFWNPTGIGIIICGIVLGMRYVHSQ
jgi:serine/threonine protein kinase